MKNKLAKLFLILVCFLWLLLSCSASSVFSHDIDNLSKFLNAFLQKDEVRYRINKNEPHHCADGLCEGRALNKCLTYPQVSGHLRTLKDINKNFWHWRRVLIAQLTLLAGESNFARGLTHGKKLIPFVNYDPFYLGRDDSFPNVFKNFKKETGLDPYSSLEMRYDLFSTAHVVYFPKFDNKLLEFKTCGTATHREKMHAPECIGANPNTVILIGGDSYKAPSPFRDEDGFIYYDRIPASPIDDACFAWLEKKFTFSFVLEYAEAHEVAGKHHAVEVKKRIVYIRKVIDEILDR